MTTWLERRALRRAERAHGMDRETRERTNSLIRSLDLPTGRTPSDAGPMKVSTLGNLSADHLHKVLTFTVSAASGEPSEVTGVLFDITHMGHTGKPSITDVSVRTGERFESFNLPSDHPCVVEEAP